MKAVICLIFLAASAMALPVDPIVSEANLAIQSKSDLVTAGNGLYNPVRTVYRPVVQKVVYRLPEYYDQEERRFIVKDGLQDLVVDDSGLGYTFTRKLVYPKRLRTVLVQ